MGSDPAGLPGESDGDRDERRWTIWRGPGHGRRFEVVEGPFVEAQVVRPVEADVERLPGAAVAERDQAKGENEKLREGWDRLTDLAAECRNLAGILRRRGTEEDRATAETLLDITEPYLAMVAEVSQDGWAEEQRRG